MFCRLKTNRIKIIRNVNKDCERIKCLDLSISPSWRSSTASGYIRDGCKFDSYRELFSFSFSVKKTKRTVEFLQTIPKKHIVMLFFMYLLNGVIQTK